MASEKTKFEAILSAENIATVIDKQDLLTIGTIVAEEYDVDKKSRADWEKEYKEANKFALLKPEPKNTPWPGASNIKYPLITQATINFSSRAYPNIIKGSQVVKGKVIGKDKDGEKRKRANRIAMHMNYQLIDEMEDWEDGMDKMLSILPLVGCGFKKTWYDPVIKQNVSKYILANDVIINYRAKSVEKASRITHIFTLLPNEIEENIRNDKFLEFKYTDIPDDDEKDNETGYDKDRPHTFLEQHRYLDLDKDGYKEPYVVTVFKTTKEVVRIVARWDADGIERKDGKIIKIHPVHYFTRYIFLQSLDGGIYGMGYGKLLAPMNDIINTSINQLFDAGQDEITGGGWYKRGTEVIKSKDGGVITFVKGEYKPVSFQGDDIRKAFFERKTTKPSIALLKLLDLMIRAAEKLGSNTEVLSGKQTGSNIPASTTLALIEQSLQVFNSVYKRIHRALKSELQKLYRLNRLYLPEEVYFNVMDDPAAIKREDYENKDIDVTPISDPENITNVQKMMIAEAIMELRGTGLNDEEIVKRYLQAFNVPDIDMLLEGEPPPEDPEITIKAEEVELKRRELKLKEKKLLVEEAKTDAEIKKMGAEGKKFLADALKSVADAEAVKEGSQIDQYKKTVEGLKEKKNEDVGTVSGGKGAMESGTDNDNVLAGVGGTKTGQGKPNGGGEQPELKLG